MSNQLAREDFVDYLRLQLIGPCGGESEILNEPPGQRYLMGLLYPQSSSADEVFEDDLIDENPSQGGTDDTEDPIALATQRMPSSVGISFVVTNGTTVSTAVSAARYEKSGKSYSRNQLGNSAGLVQSTPQAKGIVKRTRVLDDCAEVVEVWRPFREDWIVTIALVNILQSTGKQFDNEDLLCQVSLSCTANGGNFKPYPTADRSPKDPEDEEQALLYQHLPTYAIGHGCSAEWIEGSSESVGSVHAEFMPTEVIPGVSFDIPGFEDILSLQTLMGIEAEVPELSRRLDKFVVAYRDWILSSFEACKAPARLIGAQGRLHERLNLAADRIAEGVELLSSKGPRGDRVRAAFALANRAMLMQILHSGDNLGGSRRTLENSVDPSTAALEASRAKWRPFQLAFILLSLPSVVDSNHPDRDTVDLIWFPTGGGKTEAYLGLVAFQIFYRRLEHGDTGSGTTVITRYTLRLLTTQQFQRAAVLTCAMESLRRKDITKFGEEVISIGIWVGGGTTPNSYSDAVELLKQLQDGDRPTKGFQVETCPWCGTEIIPKLTTSKKGWGVSVTNNTFKMRCPNDRCEFHDSLPISVVDEDLYNNPPTFLIATIDKFARMAWDDRAGRFLGASGARGPSLIIQDELHLISGPLGTVAAIYEAAFDIVMRGLSDRPKVIAATATIRRAGDQVKSLFDRDVFLFPPAGMSSEDSFFIRIDRTLPGRRYVGVMAQSHTPTTATVHTMAAMLQAPLDLQLAGDELDAYWTLVEYHNSLRELGKSVTLARDDVPARISVIADQTNRTRSLESDSDLIELTSNISSVQIPKNLEILGRPHGVQPAVSVVACTNMFSVGVDVPRLGLMLVIGQPKSTSEYIQATSRVGRDERRPPGLIVTLYSSAKPRDRSHYETFKAYHRAIYREVEPTSVTPWALPARERALHAVLVIVARNLLGLPLNEDAAKFTNGVDVERIINLVLERVKRVDDREVDDTRDHLVRLADEWENAAQLASVQNINTGGNNGVFRYSSQGKGVPSLLKRFTNDGPGWPTLDSMRNVDHEALIKILGEKKQ